MVLYPEACWVGLPMRVKNTNIYNLETGKYSSTPPFSKKAFDRSYPVPQICAGSLELLKLIFKFEIIFSPGKLYKNLLCSQNVAAES